MGRRSRLWIAVVFAWLGAAGVSSAAEQSRTLRLIGQADSATDPAPKRFALDLKLEPGDAEFQTRASGWFAVLPPGSGSAEVQGTCVEAHCALSVDLDAGKLAISGDLLGASGPGPGRFSMTLSEDSEKPPVSGAIAFSPVSGPIEQVGTLAAPDAVTADDLDDLLMWNGSPVGFGNATKTLPDDTERGALATWQGAAGRPATGLITAEDLEALRAKAKEARQAAGWTAIGEAGAGWSAGYPAALLPKASQEGRERRFESADGKARLVIAIDPPPGSDGFDALVKDLTADQPGQEDRSYTRINDEMEIDYTLKGVAMSAAYHNREGGLARVVFTYPADQADKWEMYRTILVRSLKAGEDLKAK